MSDTLTAIRTEITTALGGRSDLTTLINDQINYAVQEIATMFRFREMNQSATFSTVDGTYVYALPSDFYSIIGVYDETNDHELDHQKKWHFESIDETDTGERPNYFALFNTNLYIWNSIPGSTVLTMRLDYQIKHALLVNDNDATLFPNEWNRGVRLLSLTNVLRALGEREAARDNDEVYVRWLGMHETPGEEEDRNARQSRIIML